MRLNNLSPSQICDQVHLTIQYWKGYPLSIEVKSRFATSLRFLSHTKRNKALNWLNRIWPPQTNLGLYLEESKTTWQIQFYSFIKIAICNIATCFSNLSIKYLSTTRLLKDYIWSNSLLINLSLTNFVDWAKTLEGSWHAVYCEQIIKSH